MEEGISSGSSKPWGGKLEAARDYPDPAMNRFDSVSWVGLLLRKGAELSLLAALLAVPMMYQWDFPVRTQAWLQQALDGGRFFDYQVIPWIGGMMPVLESKFGAWAVLGILMIVFYMSARFVEIISKRRFFPGNEVGGDESRKTPHRLVPMICIAVYLGLGLLSLVFWAPEVPAEAQPYASGGEDGGLLGSLGGGGFLFSSITWAQVAFGLFFFIVAEDLIRRRPFVVKILGVIVFAGVVNAIWVLLIKLNMPLLTSIWVRFGEGDHRNNFGAFIGHNTGMSSFMMTPILVALTWVFAISPKRNRTLRILLAVGILIMTMAVIIAQSRAVIPILCVLVPLMLFLLARRSVLLLGTRLYIWLPVAVVFLVVTQLIDSQYNPFIRRDITLEQRVGQLTPSHLTTETRLRILWVSSTELIPASLLIGHGLGTFQYVYPLAQGEFYRRNPASGIAPTSLRTMRAHNEYLQILVELGIIGLLTVAVALFFLFRGAWGILQRTLMPHHIATQVAVFCGVLALLAHSALDFPLRVPPTALTIVILLAILSAGDRLWLFPLRPPVPNTSDDDQGKDPPTEETGIALPPEPGQVGARRDRAIHKWMMGGAVTLVFGAGIGVLAVAWMPFQSIATLVNRGQSMLEGARMGGPRSFDYLRAGQEDLRVGRRHFWIHGPVNRIHSQAQLLRARFTIEEANRIEDLEVASQVRMLGVSYATHGITDINQALSEENFHVLYRSRAALHNLISRNHPDESARRRHRQEELEDLFRATSINPGDPDTLYLLIQVLEEDVSRNRSFLVDYIRTLNHFHPGYFRETLYAQALDALALGEWDLALMRMDLLMEAVSNDLGIRHTWSTAAVQAGRISDARRMLNELNSQIETSLAARRISEGERTRLRQLREAVQLSFIQVDILSGNNTSAHREINRDEDWIYLPESMLLAWRLHLEERVSPNNPEIDEMRAEIEKLAESDPIALQIAGVTASHVFRDHAGAVNWMRKREAIADPPMDLVGYVTLARALERQGRIRDAMDVFGPWNPSHQRFTDIDNMIGTPYSRYLAQQYAMGLRNKLTNPTED
ncbi:MAG: O-antigen ligase family protein [Candidatus Sumerlaeia bacterium]|nr:O-antigen ligase family protein [Candidatus Sumerlaeia bacterium]